MRVLTLIIERDPLGLSCAFDTIESHSAVVTVDAGCNNTVASKVLRQLTLALTL